MKKLLTGLALLMVGSTAQADFTVRQFNEAKQHGGVEWQGMRLYVMGAGDGLANANAKLAHGHKPQLYCVPENLALQPDNYIQLIENQITAGKQSPDMMISILLVLELEITFPCPQAND